MNLVAETLANRVLVIAAILGLMVAGLVSMATATEPEAIYFNGKIVTLDAAGIYGRRGGRPGPGRS